MAAEISLKSLFLAAVEMPPKQRAAFLDKATAGDAALRKRVEAILQVHDDAPRAIESAKKACELTSFENPTFVETLAASYAQAGEKEGTANTREMLKSLPK